MVMGDQSSAQDLVIFETCVRKQKQMAWEDRQQQTIKEEWQKGDIRVVMAKKDLEILSKR